MLTTFPAADEVLSLPGWNDVLPSRHFSGYLDLPGGDKHLHYWLVLSEGKPASDPITLWLNGGPGCSSLDGLLYEHGPFRFDPKNSSNLVRFDYTWAKQSNMLYLEAPVGVGFSYSDNPVDYECTDDSAAIDNMHAVEKFFSLFPELKTHDFFITGESYGGIYVPTLAEQILLNTNYSGAKLKGIAVGNGCVGSEIGVCGPDHDIYTAEYFATSTALLGEELQNEINQKCAPYKPESVSAECEKAIDKMSPLLDRINTYDVYGECIAYTPAQKLISQSRQKAPVNGILKGPEECINSIEASTYLQRPDVVKAIHTIPVPDWAVCNTVKGWSYKSTRPNLARDTYPFLIKNIRVIIYNGDFDACVPWTDNAAWTEGMGYTATQPWHPWTYETVNGRQIGGYSTRYGNNNDFTFTTVRGGRHEVPESAPEAAAELLRRLLTGASF